MRLPFVAFIIGSFALGGCAGSEETDIDASVDSGVKLDAAKDTGKDAGKDSNGPTCVPQCSTDTECQNTCPIPQSGISCCDTQTSLCYVSSAQACPAPQDGGSQIDP